LVSEENTITSTRRFRETAHEIAKTSRNLSRVTNSAINRWQHSHSLRDWQWYCSWSAG